MLSSLNTCIFFLPLKSSRLLLKYFNVLKLHIDEFDRLVTVSSTEFWIKVFPARTQLCKLLSPIYVNLFQVMSPFLKC